MQAPGIQPPPQFSFPGPPSPQLPARSQSVRVPKNLRNLCLVISEKGHQGPERGRDLPEVTQQIRILSQGAVPSSFNRRDPPLPYLGLGVGRPQGPRRRDKVWAGSVPACLSHWSAALGTPPPPNAGHASSGDGESAGLGTGPAPGNPLQVGRSQQALRPQVRETPSLTAQFPVPCALHLFSPRKNGGLERAGPWPESHGKMTAEWEIERGFQTLCLLACFAGELFPSSPQVRAPSSCSTVPPPTDVYSPPAVASAPHAC